MVLDMNVPVLPSRPSKKSAPADPQLQCRERAARILGIRAHAIAELRRKLLRSFPASIVEAVLAEFAAAGHLDDRRFAAAYLDWRGGSRGPARLRQELARKGVPRDIIDEALAIRRAEADPEDEAKQIQALAERKWQSIRDRSEILKAKARVARFLAARGYSSDAIYQALKRLK